MEQASEPAVAGGGSQRARVLLAACRESPLTLFLSFTKAKLLEPNMKFQSWPLGDKHIFFTFHIGVSPGGERDEGPPVALAQHQLTGGAQSPHPITNLHFIQQSTQEVCPR